MRFVPKYGTKTVRNTLCFIRDLIDRRWMKGDLTDGHGRYCLLGAIRKIDGSFENSALTHLRAEVWDGNIIRFNDSGETRKRDVLAVIDRAIAKVRA